MIAKHLTGVEKITFQEAKNIARKSLNEEMLLVERSAELKKQKLKSILHIFPTLKRVKQILRIRTRAKALFNHLFCHGCHPSIYPEYFVDYKRVREAVLSSKLTSDDL